MKTCFVLYLAIVIGVIGSSKPALAQVQTVESLIDSSQYYLILGKVTKARSHLILALKRSQSEKELAKIYYFLGKVNDIEGRTEEAYSNFMKSSVLAEKHNLKKLSAEAYTGAANELVSLERLDSAALLCKMSMELDSSMQSKTANNLLMARYWQSNDQNDKALSYFQQAVDQALSIGDKEALGIAYSGIASIYYSQYSDMEQTLQFLTMAAKAFDSVRYSNRLAYTYVKSANAWMVRGNDEQARYYLEKAKKIIDISGNLPTKAYWLSSQAIFAGKDGDLHEVIRYGEEALQIKKELGNRRAFQNDLLNLAIWHMELNQYSRARAYLEEGIANSTTLNDPVYLSYYYETFAELDSLNGDLGGAFMNLKKAQIYKDSVYSLSKAKAVEEIKEKYESLQKEKTIAAKELMIEKQKYQLAITIGISVVSILSVVAFLLWRLSLHRARFQKEQEYQNALRLHTIVHTQEEVQQRIARDIHDGIVQTMGAAKLALQAVNMTGEKEVIQQRIQEASYIIDEACTEARLLSHHILPYSLMKGGLLPALEELFQKSLVGSQYSFQHHGGEIRIEQTVEINVYRIAQELVQNIVKHSKATSVTASLTMTQEVLTLTIADNGIGFDKAVIYNSAGLTNLSTRAQLIKAKLSLDSVIGKGTKAQLQVEI